MNDAAYVRWPTSAVQFASLMNKFYEHPEITVSYKTIRIYYTSSEIKYVKMRVIGYYWIQSTAVELCGSVSYQTAVCWKRPSRRRCVNRD